MSGENTGGPIECPRFSVNSFQTLASPTELTVLALSQVAGMSGTGALELGSVPAVQLGLSFAVAKELCVLLQEQVDRHEKENGEITTQWLRAKSAE